MERLDMKKIYIKPCIDVIAVCVECQGNMLPDSYRIYDKEGNLEGSGSIIEDLMPGDAEEEDKVKLVEFDYNLWD